MVQMKPNPALAIVYTSWTPNEEVYVTSGVHKLVSTAADSVPKSRLLACSIGTSQAGVDWRMAEVQIVVTTACGWRTLCMSYRYRILRLSIIIDS